MKSLCLAAALCGSLPSCAEVSTYGQAAAEYRRQMNDLQAKGTIDALCDISVGAYFRLPPAKRSAVDGACGGGTSAQSIRMAVELPVKLQLAEPTTP